MGKIIVGLMLQGVGAGLFFSISGKQEAQVIVILLVLASAASLGGIYQMLSGLRVFLLKDVLEELKKMSVVDQREYFDAILAELKKISTNTTPRT